MLSVFTGRFCSMFMWTRERWRIEGKESMTKGLLGITSMWKGGLCIRLFLEIREEEMSMLEPRVYMCIRVYRCRYVCAFACACVGVSRACTPGSVHDMYALAVHVCI